MADRYVDFSYDTDENAFGTPSTLVGTITGATAANPVVITAVAHGFFNGNTVLLRSLGGMVELNDRSFTVANKTNDTFELTGENGEGHTTYTTGGTATKQMSTSNAMRVLYDDTVSPGALHDAGQKFKEWVSRFNPGTPV